MKLEVRNVFTAVVEATDEERAWLREYLAFDDASAYFRHRTDNKIRLFELTRSRFPTGFLGVVRTAGAERGFAVDVTDYRIPPCVEDPSADVAWLRPYQFAGAKRAVVKRRGILKLPTAAGKTEVAIALTRMLPTDWLFLVHKSTLLSQTAQRYEDRTGLRAGRVGDGVWHPQPRFTVATFQTLSRALVDERLTNMPGAATSLLGGVGGLLVDEAHTLAAESFSRVAMACGAYYRIGLSATPFARGDRRSPIAVGALGHQIFELLPKELQDAGVLSIPKIRFVPVVQESHLASAEPTMQGIKGELINGSTLRNQVLVKICQRAEKPCLLFVEQLRHGRELRHRLEKAGVNCDFVFGADDTGRREAVVQRLVRGEIDVLVTSAIFQEGVDIPSLRSVVVACGGKSTIATLQRIGRGMRVTPGKTTFEVWDVLDQGQKWLEKHAKARMKAYEREGYPVETLGGLP